MAKFIKKPVTIDASQWFKNGDHHGDHDPIGIQHPSAVDLRKYQEYKEAEGKVVRYYRHPDVAGGLKCKHCSALMSGHGWIDTLEGGHIVCPGDWIITGIKGENYPCKPDIFTATYYSEVEYAQL
ncbi:MAG: hypothetical protein K2X80_07345 [Pseudomonadaceae bacterium]|nr:hypothetical protein [Pseudomonadaceae bacterium]